MKNSNMDECYLFSDKMNVKFVMICTLMLNWITREVDIKSTVAVNK